MPFIGNKPSAVPLTSADIADGIITSAKIVDATIANADIANSTINLTTKVTGSLPVANGGTGLTALGSANQVLAVNSGGTALAYTAVSSDYVLLATTDASSSSSVSFDGYFTSTYKNYQVIFSTVKSSTSAQHLLRVRKSNADQTGGNYRYAYSFVSRSSGANAISYSTGWTDTYSQLDPFAHNGTSNRRNGIIDIFDPLNTDGFKSIWYRGFNMQNDDEVDAVCGGLFYAVTGALSGVTFYPSAGTITSGNYKLYGIK